MESLPVPVSQLGLGAACAKACCWGRTRSDGGDGSGSGDSLALIDLAIQGFHVSCLRGWGPFLLPGCVSPGRDVQPLTLCQFEVGTSVCMSQGCPVHSCDARLANCRLSSRSGATAVEVGRGGRP